MRVQNLNKICEFCNFEYSGKKIAVKSFQGNSKRHFVLPIADTILNHKVNNLFVLFMLFNFLLTLAAFNIPFNAFVD